MITKRDVAREMLAIFDGKPERWTQHVYAKTKTGDVVPPECASACCWCLMGALRLACDQVDADDDEEVFIETCSALERSAASAIPRWNDAPERTFEDVVKLLTEVAEGAA
jgi:hypothetical protein